MTWKPPKRPNELYHWAAPKSHRYIAKIGEGKDARYFYTQEELQAYKNQKNNLSNTEKQVKLEEYQRAANGYRGKDQSLGEVKFQRGEQRGMTKEDRDNLKNYWNDAENRKEFHDTHAADEEWYNKTKKKANKISEKREKEAREQHGHTREDMAIRERDARIEERGPTIAKTRSQSANDAKNEQMKARSHESRSSAKDRVRKEKEDRLVGSSSKKASDFIAKNLSKGKKKKEQRRNVR